jgi:hypothetical protein
MPNATDGKKQRQGEGEEIESKRNLNEFEIDELLLFSTSIMDL